MPQFQPAQYAGGAAGGGGHVELLFAHAGGYTVVHHHAVFIQHQAVAALAGFQLRPSIGIDAVQKLAGIGAVDLDFTQRRGIHYAHAVAGGQAFAVDRGMNVFAGFGEVPRAQPLADRLKLGTARHMALVHGGDAFRVESVTGIQTCQGAQTYRGISRAVSGGADLLYRYAHRFGG